MRITRLGEGVDRTGRLAEAAMNRTVEVLVEFKKEMDHHGVSRARVTATSAARDAENEDELARQVARVVGSVPEVLAGKEEARLTYLGATSGLDKAEGPYLVIDVGGGSTELVGGGCPELDAGGSTELVGGGCPELDAISLEMGCVRVTERFFEHDPPLAAELAAAGRYVSGLVGKALEAQPGLGGASRLIGVAGTVSALVRLELGLVDYDRDRIHLAKLSRGAIERLLSELAAAPVAQRRDWPALEAERADVIVGGTVVLAEAMVALGFDELTASESDLLDGVASELLVS